MCICAVCVLLFDFVLLCAVSIYGGLCTSLGLERHGIRFSELDSRRSAVEIDPHGCGETVRE